LLGAALLAAPACVLPAYEEVDAQGDSIRAEGGMPAVLSEAGACGLSHMLEPECDACIRQNCCELAEECGEGTECGEDLLEPITPLADFSEDFDPLLGCMQRECQRECQVNWGCVGDYEWPEPEESYGFEVRVIDYAAEPSQPIAEVDVQACIEVDAACDSGRVDAVVTDDDGKAALEVPSDFDGFFTFSGGGYLDTTVKWSEPVYRATDWTHYELQESAVEALALITGVHQSSDDEFEPGTGHFIFRVQSCLPLRYTSSGGFPSSEVAGVRVEFEPSDGASQVFYTTESGGVSTTLDASTADGLGGAFNVPARNITARAIDVESGDVVAEGLVHVREGTIGYVYFLPESRR
jgi:hypothetical protein